MKFVDKNELGPNPEYFSALKFKNLDLTPKTCSESDINSAFSSGNLQNSLFVSN